MTKNKILDIYRDKNLFNPNINNKNELNLYKKNCSNIFIEISFTFYLNFSSSFIRNICHFLFFLSGITTVIFFSQLV
jgi:hypothetical protein